MKIKMGINMKEKGSLTTTRFQPIHLIRLIKHLTERLIESIISKIDILKDFLKELIKRNK